jgi:peroxiredoxin Q/BCP
VAAVPLRASTCSIGPGTVQPPRFAAFSRRSFSLVGFAVVFADVGFSDMAFPFRQKLLIPGFGTRAPAIHPDQPSGRVRRHALVGWGLEPFGPWTVGLCCGSHTAIATANHHESSHHESEDDEVSVRLEPGADAPQFTLQDADGKPVSLSDYAGRKVIVYVYPAAMTPGCTKQACDFRDSLQSLVGAGYAVIGLSPDKPEKLAKFRERDSLNFPLVSDPEKTTLEAYGAFGEKKLYGKTVTGVIRSTFVIDENGKIERALYNVKATGHVAKLRKDLGLD